MNEQFRKVSIILELERSVKFLKIGLAEIQKISFINDFYDPVFLNLSNGLERLFKTMLCLNFEELNGRLPIQNEIWTNKNGHDISSLKLKVEKMCVSTRTFMDEDLEIITIEPFTNSICNVLSEYAKRSRYFNLDAILGTKQQFDSKREWEELENTVLIEKFGKEEFYKMLQDHKHLDKLYIESSSMIVIKIEKFIRALTRQFIFGDFSSNSKIYYSIVCDFLNIDNAELGTIDYRNLNNYEVE